jgi:pimeloyl-ACP methyl ester carboxylesterase
MKGTLPPEAMADIDSQFIRINRLNMHVKTMGEGEPAFMLLHGFGASLYSWGPVLASLGKTSKVIAFDRPAFGLTERPLSWEGQNPYTPEAQVALVLGLMDYFSVHKTILIGHSAGGTVSLNFALAYPERVSALILVSPAVYIDSEVPEFMRPLLAMPLMNHIGPMIARLIQSQWRKLLARAWHDPSRIKPETIALYEKPFHVENWDKALWELTIANSTQRLADHLDEITQPVLVITGDDDRVVPTDESIRLAGEMPNASLVVIADAGHVPQEEQPEAFMKAVSEFLKGIRT